MTQLALAKKLFDIIFKKELESRPVDVSCSDIDGKEVLDKTCLDGIQSKFNLFCFSNCCQCHYMYKVGRLFEFICFTDIGISYCLDIGSLML